MDFLKKYQSEVNTALEDFFKNYKLEKTSQAEKILKEACEYGTVLGGKRIRPILGIISFEISKNRNTKITRNDALKSLISIELIHAFSLIHDDLPAMDNDELRRGRTTVWKKYGEATGILAGDILNTLAFENIGQHAPDYALRDLVKILSTCTGLNGMGGGQARDLYFDTHKLTLETLIETHRKKTGQLIYVSVMMGAILAQASSKKKEQLKKYAEIIGLAFQIKDDLLDAEGDEKIVGKKVGKDSKKKGFIKFLGLEKTKKYLKNLIAEARKIAKNLKSSELMALTKFIQDRKT